MGGSNCETSIFIDKAHLLGLSQPVIMVVLDDAKQIDPNETEAYLANGNDGILVSLKDITPCDPGHLILQSNPSHKWTLMYGTPAM